MVLCSPPTSHAFYKSVYLEGSRPVATGGIRGQCPPNFFCDPQILLRPENLFQTYSKSKNLAPLKMCCAPPNIETWLRACLEVIAALQYNNRDDVIDACVLYLCFIKVNVLAPSSVYFSTTATYVSFCSFMHLCVLFSSFCFGDARTSINKLQSGSTGTKNIKTR